MFPKNNQATDFFREGYKTLQKGIWTIGIALVTLAVLIFLFPALIGFLFAGLILFAGLSLLYFGYRVRQIKQHLHQWEDHSGPVTTTFRTEGPQYTRRRVTIVMR